MLTAARCTSWRPCAGVAPVLSTTSLLGSTAARRAVLHPPPPVHAQRQRRRVTTNCRGRRADDSMSSSVVSQHAGQATDATPGSALKVVVVGAGPVGLAAAVALARPGADVEVHDDRLRGGWLDPQHGAEGCGTLVALGKRGLQALEDLHLSHSPQGANACADSSRSSSTDPLPGLSLLQGLVVVGPQGVVSQEEYSRSKPGSSGGVTAGIAAIAESSLTDHLSLAATAAGGTAGLDAPPSLISGAQVTAASVASAAAARHSSSGTPLPQGPTSAPSAEAAQLAAMPDTVVVADSLDDIVDEGTSGVTVRYHSQLVLLDTANKQATFLGEGGQAHVAAYDLLIAADAGSNAQLVTSSLQELQKRQAAHTHPPAATTSSSSSAVSQAGVEAEWMAWHDMPHEPCLAHLLPRGAVGVNASSASKVSSTDGHHPSGPTRGWLLAWRGSHATGASDTAAVPGAPGCTVVAWPGAMGATWSGCVLADPQVFEALRGQADYEALLLGLSGPGGARLPGRWVNGIAQQLQQHQGRIGRVRAAAGPPPAHLSAPAAGLLTLSSAAVPAAAAPQLLNPAVSLGLAEVASLVTALQAAGKQSTASVLQQFDSQHQPDAAALHNLLAQLSWLRHAHSPARSAAAESVTWGSLAWLVLRAPRTGLVLQWRCLATLLPLVAATQRMLHKLGLGRPDRPAAAAGAASTSLDSGAALAQGDKHARTRPVAATTSSPAYSLSAVLEAIEPCGASLAAFLHTTDARPRTLWRLLQWAPMLLATLWGAAFYFLALALRWSLWALRACGWAMSGVA